MTGTHTTATKNTRIAWTFFYIEKKRVALILFTPEYRGSSLFQPAAFCTHDILLNLTIGVTLCRVMRPIVCAVSASLSCVGADTATCESSGSSDFIFALDNGVCPYPFASTSHLGTSPEQLVPPPVHTSHFGIEDWI